MPLLQDIIHKIEEGAGPKYIRIAMVALAVLACVVLYNVRVARNMSAPEAMDAAQLARNISEGKGFTTHFVRPFSVHLVSQASHKAAESQTNTSDFARVRDGHPDIANAPLYPVVLAGAMKVLPFDYEPSKSRPFWSSTGRFWRYQPDFLIAWFNQALFLGVVLLTFYWAKSLFDQTVAVTASILVFVSDVLWKFSSSGLSTMLLILILLGLAWTLTAMQREFLEPRRSSTWLLAMSGAAGLLVGLAALTRYGAGWLIVPTLVFVAVFAGARRVPLSLIMAAAFAVVLIPWLGRNAGLSGTFFGTAGFDILKGGGAYSQYFLDRSLDPEVRTSSSAIITKLLVNGGTILRSELFTFGSGWVVALFFAGFMVGFRNPLLRRMRYWIVGSLGVFFLTQALGRTQLSEESQGIHSENYLVLLLPMIAVYATAFFQMLLENIAAPAEPIRHAIRGVFLSLAAAPFVLMFLPPRVMPIQYPPYYPPAIWQTAELFKPAEMLMSDVPWAVAWYGNRQCFWLTLDATTPQADEEIGDESFFAVNDRLKTVSGVYLTPRTMDMRFESEIIQKGAGSWGALIVSTLLTKDAQGQPVVPRSFPLRALAPGYLSEQMLLTDWPRWTRPGNAQTETTN